MFTLINLALLAHGHTLSRTLFTQEMIYTNQTRRQLAHIILLHSETAMFLQLIGGRQETSTTGRTKAPDRKAAVPRKVAIQARGKEHTGDARRIKPKQFSEASEWRV